MKKLLAPLTMLGYFLNTTIVAAAVNIQITPPDEGVNPTTSLGTIISSIVTIVIVIAILAVLFMLIWGAFEWITSGGEKEQVSKARGRIVNALIGLVVIALAFVIVNVVGQLLDINFLNLDLPTLEGQ